MRCKSENRVLIVAGSKELRITDVSAKASGDRLQIPSARAPGDGSREVPQSDGPSQENPSQASGDRLHFLEGQARGDLSVAQGFKWLQPFEEGLSGERPRLTQCRGGTTSGRSERAKI